VAAPPALPQQYTHLKRSELERMLRRTAPGLGSDRCAFTQLTGLATSAYCPPAEMRSPQLRADAARRLPDSTGRHQGGPASQKAVNQPLLHFVCASTLAAIINGSRTRSGLDPMAGPSWSLRSVHGGRQCALASESGGSTCSPRFDQARRLSPSTSVETLACGSIPGNIW